MSNNAMSDNIVELPQHLPMVLPQPLGQSLTSVQPLNQNKDATANRTKNIDPLDNAALAIDHAFQAIMAQKSLGVSPIAIGEAFADWGLHLAMSPGKQLQLIGKAFRKWTRFGAILADTARGSPEHFVEPLPQDRRFSDKAWQSPPFFLLSQAFLLQQQWWHNATTGVRGVAPPNENIVAFSLRQWLDIFSPSNFPLTNPVVQNRVLETGGANLLKGLQNLIEDWQHNQTHEPSAGTKAYLPGRDVAMTPGKIVFRNRLIELIQYTPQTERVGAEPILFIPAWIMKYYILDLSQSNSLVHYMVQQGFTVFMISWHNPTKADADLGMDDYKNLGIMAAIEKIKSLVPGQKIHATGYCLGGTLLSIAAATMARDERDDLKSLTFFAAQTDFTEAGELMLFINEGQIAFLEELMRQQGFLDGKQMAGAFQLLRSNDLIWSKVVHDYLMGERVPMNDLMAWNADTTRMPARMHSEYLRKLFLHNDLAEGRFVADGNTIALRDIDVPIFSVATEMDHVAPWRSVKKLHLLTDTEITFLLTSGGHNAGIVSEPGHEGRHYLVHTSAKQDHYIDPDHWLKLAERHEGSWWPQWMEWLKARSSGETVPASERAPRPFKSDAPFVDAPGAFVLEV